MILNKNKLVLHVTKHFAVNILFFPILAASILGRFSMLFAISFASAILHELAHVAAALRLKVPISGVEIQPFGICARLKASIIKNPVHEAAVAICGPGASLILAFAARFAANAFPKYGEYLTYAYICNIAMAILNLLPALPLDGGRLLRSALTYLFGAVPAYNFVLGLSRTVVAVLIAISTYMTITASFNFSFILITAFLLGNLCNEEKNLTHCKASELLNCSKKLSDDELIKSVIITAHKSTPARKILRMLSYNRYYIVCVVDDNMRVCGTLTESKIINSIIENGIKITLGSIT